MTRAGVVRFATNLSGRIADLEVQHRLRARAEDRIRCLKDTGLRNLPEVTVSRVALLIMLLTCGSASWTVASTQAARAGVSMVR
jgi:hypothetical protein